MLYHLTNPALSDTVHEIVALHKGKTRLSAGFCPYRKGYFTASLSVLEARNFGTFIALI
jgi:hypothetical protein